MATAPAGTGSTGPAATYIYCEFGVPETGAPTAYGWLGADEISDNALGGQFLMGARAYNASTGRFAQVDPLQGDLAAPTIMPAQIP